LWVPTSAGWAQVELGKGRVRVAFGAGAG